MGKITYDLELDMIRKFYSYLLCFSLLFQLQVTTIWSTSTKSESEGDWKRVYLATYPRSGNHWMRQLIEEATHIATGSVYCDREPPHMETPFPWGGYCADHGYNGDCRYPQIEDPVVVKTHFPVTKVGKYNKLPYIQTIRIVRHPVDSMFSYYVHQYEENAGNLVPKDILKKYIDAWEKFQLYWNDQPNVLTVRFEDLYNDPTYYLTIILEAIGYDVSQQDIERAVAKYPPLGGIYKHIGHYERSDLDLIKKRLNELMNQFDYSIE